MEDEASMTVGPVTAALSQMTRMSSARSGTQGPSSRPLSTRSHASRHGNLTPPPAPIPPQKALAVMFPVLTLCCNPVLHPLWVARYTPGCTVLNNFMFHHTQATQKVFRFTYAID